MKRFITYVFSGILGGLMVIGYLSVNPASAEEAKPKGQLVNQALVSNLPTAPADFISAAEKAMPAVVHIRAEESEILAKQRRQESPGIRQQSPLNDFFGLDDFFNFPQFNAPFYRQKGSGSGVIISTDGYIVTNNHVVNFADELIVTTHDQKEYKAIKIGTDPSSDLAVIKISANDLPAAEFGNSDNARIGEWVLAVGNPFDYLTSTVTAGIISAKGRDLNIIKEKKAIEEFIQTDAAINPGNSGGALVNVNGQLIGINTAIATPTGVYAGYSFAIPSNLMKRITDEIIENGNIERANLGVAGYDLDKELANELSLKLTEGFYVDSVVDGSAAQFGGIYPGDVIVAIDDNDVKNFDDLRDYLKFSKVGDEMNVLVNRDGDLKNVRVRLRKGL
jgi:Do/DeqQ family serine protease